MEVKDYVNDELRWACCIPHGRRLSLNSLHEVDLLLASLRTAGEREYHLHKVPSAVTGASTSISSSIALVTTQRVLGCCFIHTSESTAECT